jgi:eukaryotic-like serine/threonine-protein kinase
MSRDSIVRFDSIGAEVRIDVHLDVGDSRVARAVPLASPAPSAPTVATERTLQAGRIVGGRYQLVRPIGRGSMGAVWLANHTTLGQHVALKLMDPAAEAVAAEDASTSAARFRFEAQIAARLSRKTHHVVRVTDHGHDGPVPYLVMELLEGQTLEQALLGGPMGLAEVSELVTQIARGLEAAHAEGILHRDLKPANVFLANVGEGRAIVKLLDFGVAWGRGAQRSGAPFATARGLIVGTPGYMSPEQAAACQLDVRSDVWSLAAIAYEALTGELPIVGVDPDHMLSNLRACRTIPLRHRRPDLSEALDRLFQRAFAPRIEARHSTCAELALAFEQAAHPRALSRRLGDTSPAAAGARGRALARRYAPFAGLALLAGAGLLGTWCASSGGWGRADRWGSNGGWGSNRGWGSNASSRAMAVHAATRGGAAATSQATAPAPVATTAMSVLLPQAPPPSHPDARPRAMGRPLSGGDLGEFKASY